VSSANLKQQRIDQEAQTLVWTASSIIFQFEGLCTPLETWRIQVQTFFNLKAFYKLTAKHANFRIRLSGSEHLSNTG
jgi:hypothetical protein